MMIMLMTTGNDIELKWHLWEKIQEYSCDRDNYFDIVIVLDGVDNKTTIIRKNAKKEKDSNRMVICQSLDIFSEKHKENVDFHSNFSIHN